MLTELLLKGTQHHKLDSEFKTYIKDELLLEEFQIVHYQLKSNRKSLLLRLKGDGEHLVGRNLHFNNSTISVERFQRPIISTINSILDLSHRLETLGKPRLRLPKFSKVVVSKIPKSMKKREIEEKMSKFGKIDSIEILEKEETKDGKEVRYNLAEVNFDSIDAAIEAFHSDRVKIRARFFKIKLYLNPYKVRAFLKRYKLKPKSGEGQNIGKSEAQAPINISNTPYVSSQLTTNNTSPVNRNSLPVGGAGGQQGGDFNFQGERQSGIPGNSFTSYNLHQHLKHVQNVRRRTISQEYFKIGDNKKIQLREGVHIHNVGEIHHPSNLRFNKGNLTSYPHPHPHPQTQHQPSHQVQNASSFHRAFYQNFNFNTNQGFFNF